MQLEVSVALNFVMNYLYNKLPRRRVDMFAEEIEKGLRKKFEGHWYPNMPCKGSGFRCMRVGQDKMDPVLTSAAQTSGLDTAEILEYLPKDMTVWIDPHEVSCRIGEKGPVRILYSGNKGEVEEAGSSGTPAAAEEADQEVQSHSFNPDTQSFRPIDALSSSLNNVSLSPSPSAWLTQSGSTSPSHNPTSSTSPVNSFASRNASKTTTFTAASFAQTKFGSTKLKTQAKRPSRLSPTEMGSFIKQRSPPGGPWGSMSPVAMAGGVSPVSGVYPGGVGMPMLSPSNPRLDMLEQQQRIFVLQQQQQQLQQQQQMCQLQPGSNLSSPIGGASSYHDLYSPTQNADLLSPGSHIGLPSGLPGPGSVAEPRKESPHNASPEHQPGKATTPEDPTSETLVWNSKPAPYSIQHLLVAN